MTDRHALISLASPSSLELPIELVATIAKKLDATRNELPLFLPNQLSAKAAASDKKLSPKTDKKNKSGGIFVRTAAPC